MIKNNIIYNKDCLLGMKELDDNSIDLIVTSPPYYNARDYSSWDSLDDYIKDMKDILIESKRVLKNHRYIVWNVGDIVQNMGGAKWNNRKLPLGSYFISIMEEIGLIFIDDIIWDKGEPQSKRHLGNPPYPFYQYPVNVYEHILIFRKSDIDKTRIPCPDCNEIITVSNSQSSIGVQSWECKNPKCKSKSKSGRGKRFSERSIMMNNAKTDENIIEKEMIEYWRRDIVKINPVIKINSNGENILNHTAPFPIEIPDMAINYYTNVGDIVLDPFIGSGTTAISAINNNRNYIGYEYNESFYNSTIKRLKSLEK